MVCFPRILVDCFARPLPGEPGLEDLELVLPGATLGGIGCRVIGIPVVTILSPSCIDHCSSWWPKLLGH